MAKSNLGAVAATRDSAGKKRIAQMVKKNSQHQVAAATTQDCVKNRQSLYREWEEIGKKYDLEIKMRQPQLDLYQLLHQ